MSVKALNRILAIASHGPTPWTPGPFIIEDVLFSILSHRSEPTTVTTLSALSLIDRAETLNALNRMRRAGIAVRQPGNLWLPATQAATP